MHRPTIITLQEVRWQTHVVVSLLLSLDWSMNFSTNSILLQITHKPINIVLVIYHLYMQTLIDVSIYAELIIIKKQHGEIVSYISLSNHEHGKRLVCFVCSFVYLFIRLVCLFVGVLWCPFVCLFVFLSYGFSLLFRLGNDLKQ